MDGIKLFCIILRQLYKATPTNWLLILFVCSAFLSGCLFFSFLAAFPSSDSLIYDPTFKAIVITFFVLLLNAVIRLICCLCQSV